MSGCHWLQFALMMLILELIESAEKLETNSSTCCHLAAKHMLDAFDSHSEGKKAAKWTDTCSLNMQQIVSQHCHVHGLLCWVLDRCVRTGAISIVLNNR